MESKLKEQVNNSGLKKKYIAAQLSIHQSVLSMCLNGERTLAIEKQDQLKELLKKVS